MRLQNAHTLTVSRKKMRAFGFGALMRANATSLPYRKTDAFAFALLQGARTACAQLLPHILRKYRDTSARVLGASALSKYKRTHAEGFGGYSSQHTRTPHRVFNTSDI